MPAREQEGGPVVDLDQEMKSVYFGTKIRIEATIESELYKEIQRIILAERKVAQERDMPELAISNVVEMILRKGVRIYQQEERARTSAPPPTKAKTYIP